MPHCEQMCEVADCTRAAKKAGRCWGHWKKRNQPPEKARQPLKEYADTPWAALVKVGLEYAAVDDLDDAGFRRLEERYRAAVHRYALSLPFVRNLIRWAAEQEQFRRLAAKQMRQRAPLPSVETVKWAGREVREALKDAQR